MRSRSGRTRYARLAGRPGVPVSSQAFRRSPVRNPRSSVDGRENRGILRVRCPVSAGFGRSGPREEALRNRLRRPEDAAGDGSKSRKAAQYAGRIGRGRPLRRSVPSEVRLRQATGTEECFSEGRPRYFPGCRRSGSRKPAVRRPRPAAGVCGTMPSPNFRRGEACGPAIRNGPAVAAGRIGSGMTVFVCGRIGAGRLSWPGMRRQEKGHGVFPEKATLRCSGRRRKFPRIRVCRRCCVRRRRPACA